MPRVGFYERPCHSVRFTEIHPVVRISCGAHHSLSSGYPPKYRGRCSILALWPQYIEQGFLAYPLKIVGFTPRQGSSILWPESCT
jgi:hypothetical protein